MIKQFYGSKTFLERCPLVSSPSIIPLNVTLELTIRVFVEIVVLIFHLEPKFSFSGIIPKNKVQVPWTIEGRRPLISVTKLLI